MLKKYNNTIYKLLLRSKKIIKVILNSLTRIGLIIYIKDSKEAFSIDYIYIKKNTKIKKTTKADIATTSYPIKNDTISVINLDAN